MHYADYLIRATVYLEHGTAMWRDEAPVSSEFMLLSYNEKHTFSRHLEAWYAVFSSCHCQLHYYGLPLHLVILHTSLAGRQQFL